MTTLITAAKETRLPQEDPSLKMSSVLLLCRRRCLPQRSLPAYLRRREKLSTLESLHVGIVRSHVPNGSGDASNVFTFILLYFYDYYGHYSIYFVYFT